MSAPEWTAKAQYETQERPHHEMIDMRASIRFGGVASMPARLKGNAEANKRLNEAAAESLQDALYGCATESLIDLERFLHGVLARSNVRPAEHEEIVRRLDKVMKSMKPRGL